MIKIKAQEVFYTAQVVHPYNCLAYVFLEYASLGSVYSYCSDNSKELQFEQIVKWATDISKGSKAQS